MTHILRDWRRAQRYPDPTSVRTVLSLLGWGGALGVLTVVSTLAAVRVFQDAGSRAPLYVVGVVLAGVALLRVPTHWLPSVALVAYSSGAVLLVPSSVPLPTTTAILLVWALRRSLSSFSNAMRSPAGQRRGGAIMSGRDAGNIDRDRRPLLISRVVALLLIIWLAVLVAFADLGPQSVGWVRDFVPLVLLPIFFLNLRQEARSIVYVWSWMSAILAIYSIIEFLLQRNFLFWALGAESSQHWSVYRSEGPFAHPLLFGTFLSVGATLLFGMWLQGRRPLLLIGAIVVLAGLIATSSRGSIVAGLVGAAIAITLTVLTRREVKKERAFALVLLLVAASVIAINFSPLLDRWTSAEAEGSSSARSEVLVLALDIVNRDGYFGTGGGTSSLAAVAAGSSLPIELSPFQALVSLGLTGAILLLLLLALALVYATRVGAFPQAAGLIAFAVSVSGYNYLDDRRSGLILFGLVLIMTWGSMSSTGESRVSAAMTRGGGDA